MQITAAMVKELRDASGAGMSACKNALVEANGDLKRASEILREKGLAAAAKKAGRVAAEGLVFVAVTEDRQKGVMVEVNSETDFVAKNENFVNFGKQVTDQALKSTAETVEALLEEKWAADPSQTVKDVLTQQISTIGENIGIRRFERYEVAENSAIIEYVHGGGRVGVMVEMNYSNGDGCGDACDNACTDAGKNICMQIAAMSPQYVCKNCVDPNYIASEKEFHTKQALAEGKPANIAEKMAEGRINKTFKEICLMEQEYVKEDGMSVAEYLRSVGKDHKCTPGVTRFVRYEKGEGIEKKEENFAEEVSKAMQG
ncbi:MAG: translation elongation factor Ts [Defluviitaleaceae bacterium]|nr:translation elongation factor Ts [Defluviitaleaceae bacterium]MCL2274773.1 translation elongation factor Ts [Defluviitaleaceae bacterium]